MKQNYLRLGALLLCLVCLLSLPARAVEGTSYTYTLSADRTKLVLTADAYLPAGIYFCRCGPKLARGLISLRAGALHRGYRQPPHCGLFHGHG